MVLDTEMVCNLGNVINWNILLLYCHNQYTTYILYPVDFFKTCISTLEITIINSIMNKKIIKYHAIKTYGEWRYSTTIPDLGTRWRGVDNFTLPPEKEPSVPIRCGWMGPGASVDAVE
jgi:hypothetical protein